VAGVTGGEFITGAAAAGGLAKKALKESESEKSRLADASKDHPATMVAADAFAKRMAIRQTVLLKLYEPLARLVGIRQEYFDNQFAEDMARKTAHIPDGHMRTPPPSVAIPAMQSLGYSLDEPDLREMYLNLLAAATDDRREGDAHPAFAEIIRQLSPEEASILLESLSVGNQPLAQVQRTMDGSPGYRLVRNHLVYIAEDDTDEPVPSTRAAVWIDNWVRLGLVVARYDASITNDAAYEWCEQHPEFTELCQGAAEGETFSIRRGVMIPTDFGKRFAAAVSETPEAREVDPNDGGAA
jgi:hypothetical protein